jgi:acetyl-CoA carboxylase biotin carboxyl carrier protein
MFSAAVQSSAGRRKAEERELRCRRREPRAGRRPANVAKENLTYEDLLRIVELVKSSPQFSEFRLKVGEIELHLKRKREASPAAVPGVVAPPDGNEPAEAAAQPQARQPAAAWPAHWIVVRSPMVGTFYRAPTPGAAPFVQIGHTVEAEATVCIIEVMKLMNSIPAGARGVVREILADDAQAVEYGQPLVVLEPQ